MVSKGKWIGGERVGEQGSGTVELGKEQASGVKEVLWSDSETEISWSKVHSVGCGLRGR